MRISADGAGKRRTCRQQRIICGTPTLLRICSCGVDGRAMHNASSTKHGSSVPVYRLVSQLVD